jgi:hypothetical protein
MKFKDVTFEDVEQILSVMMKNKTSFSHDNISNKQLRFISKEISFPLSHLINISLRTNYIPESWKTAKIVPLLKSGDSRLTTNYRPISLLPTLSKVLEKVVHMQSYRFLHNNDIIYRHQYGFRKSHNCQSLLLKLQNVLYEAKSAKKHTLAVFVDLKKKPLIV